MNQRELTTMASPTSASIPCASKQLPLQEREILYPHQQASLPVHPSSKTLCQRCSKLATAIDCYLPCSDKKPFLKSFFLEEIHGVSETTSKSCRLCKFWLRLHRYEQDHLQLSAYYHWTSSTSNESRHLFCEHKLFYQMIEMFTLTVLRKRWDPTGKLPFNPTGKLIPVCDKQAPWFRPLNAARIDFKVPRKWLKECGDTHLQCSKGERTLIPGLKLIDCYTRRIVHDAIFDYVALSYIWGPQSVQPNKPQTKPLNDGVLPPLPETIENAMKVTTELGFRYLWVDKYCILQDDADRHLQIGHMDEIYIQANLTLVALGRSPCYGLPGVGSRARHHQEKVDIGGHTWIYMDQNPQEEIQSSKWSTRAWTYQEALLPRRRLFFTDREIYFECRNFFRSEAFDFPLNILDLDDSLFSDGGGIFPDRGVGDEAWQVLHRIGEYSKREMSFESDILNGFLGLFRVFFTKGVRHCWGIPFSSKNEKDWPKRMFLDPPYRPISFAEGLCWESYGGAKRRKGFPTWSWTGWFGGVTWADEILGYDGMRGEKPLELHVKLEVENGELVTLEEYTDDNSLYFSKRVMGYVHLSAHITSMTIEMILPEKWRTARITTEEGNEPEKLWGIHLGTRENVEEEGDSEGMVKYPLLIVRDLGDYMERVGIVYEFDEGIYERRNWGSVRLG